MRAMTLCKNLSGYGELLLSYSYKYCPAIGMQNGGEGLPSINFEGRALLVKMLKTLEQHGIF